MLSCKETSYLASKKLDKNLSIREHLNYILHIMMCGICRRYGYEIKKLHQIFKKVGKSDKSLVPESVKLSKQSRTRIKQALDDASNSSEQ